MSSSKEYKAIKNFFHNELGLTRKELKNVVEDIIRDMVSDAIKRYFETNEFDNKIFRTINGGGSYYDKIVEGSIRSRLPAVIDNVLTQYIKNSFELNLSITERSIKD